MVRSRSLVPFIRLDARPLHRVSIESPKTESPVRRLGEPDHWQGGVAAILEAFGEWRMRARSRAALAELDADALRDIGLWPSEARREAAKPFWRP
jgi:uncharacterized protein YjiS (DUF1127 family)